MMRMDHEESFYTVGEVARSLKITVRMLHHWEAQGLIEPSERSWSNYRLYTHEDVERIQQILIYRGTGMKLAEIKELLVDGSSPLEHLRRQREALMEQQARLLGMVRAIDTLLEKEMEKEKLELAEIAEIIGDANFVEYQAEAEERYGDSDDWGIYQGRARKWDAAQWEFTSKQMEEIDGQLAQALRAGVASHSAEAAELVEKHREVLSAFFPVSPAKHYLISRGYVGDERFKKYYDSQEEGLAQWLADAIAHVAEAHGVDLENPEWA